MAIEPLPGPSFAATEGEKLKTDGRAGTWSWLMSSGCVSSESSFSSFSPSDVEPVRAFSSRFLDLSPLFRLWSQDGLLFRRCSRSIADLNRSSNAFLRTATTNEETNMAEPRIISRNRRTCWNEFKVDKLTVFSPASVIADTARNKQSMNLTLRDGVELPHSTTAKVRDVIMK